VHTRTTHQATNCLPESITPSSARETQTWRCYGIEQADRRPGEDCGHAVAVDAPLYPAAEGLMNADRVFEAPVIVEDPCKRWNADRGGHGRDLDEAVARWTLHETAGMDDRGCRRWQPDRDCFARRKRACRAPVLVRLELVHCASAALSLQRARSRHRAV